MNRVSIIAEAGVNHNGSIVLAKEMVVRAKEAGADYIKFQTFVPGNLVSKYASKAEYQKKNTGEKQTQLQMLEKLALSKEDFVELQAYCRKVGIGFASTPFDAESIDFLKTMHMDFWKVPSGEITNLPYLEKIGRIQEKVVLSTGMCEINEIGNAIAVLEDNGAKEIVVLHCNTEYPTAYEDANLLAMVQMKQIFDKPVGYSDHTLGIEVPVAAVALGASVIEKHFTLDRSMEGPDHKASLEVKQLKEMVEAIRNVEASLGDGCKKRTESEKKNVFVARKSIVAKCDIKEGEKLSEDNITVKRPGNGVSPMLWHEVLGTSAIRNFKEDELIEL